MAAKTLEKYLKELRNACGYSQEFIASNLNITRQTYSHYETGRIIPPVNALYNLAKLYGVPVDNFLELLVTYNINEDMGYNAQYTAHTPQYRQSPLTDDLSYYIDFINAPENKKKFKHLNRDERHFLFYYLLLDERDQNDILTFMKAKFENRLMEQRTADGSK